MNKKFILGAFVALLALVNFGLTSCSSDDEKGDIKINITELGHGNLGVGHIGEDLHVEAEIVSAAKIADITVDIKQKNGTFAITKTFNDYAGQTNADFHKHIDVPADAPEGNYTFFITVKDINGFAAKKAKDMKLEKESEEDHDHDHEDHDHEH